MSTNKVFLCGNLTRDPEVRATPSGLSIVSFGIAVNDRVKNGATGEWEDKPNYFDCVMFGRRGEYVAKRSQKGSRVLVEGKLRWSTWTDQKTGAKRSKVDILCDEVTIFTNTHAEGQHTAPAAPPAPPAPADDSVYADSDLPF